MNSAKHQPFLQAQYLMNKVQTLQRVALLGTDRAARQLPIDPLPTGAARDQRDAPAWALQWMAQTDVISRAAGVHVRLAAQSVSQAPAAQGLDAPCLLPLAAQVALTQCLVMGTAGKDLVIDLLRRAHAAGLCLPDNLLFDVLDFVVRHPDDCAIPFRWHSLLGARGLWLVQQNPAWSGLLECAEVFTEMTLDEWACADLSQRLEYLSRLGQSQSTAAGGKALQARDFIESTRASDPPSEVASYLLACEAGLTMDDHDWLEGLLDAKHKPVRTAAAACLSKLPHSAFCQRALDYLTAPGKAGDGQAVLTISTKRSLFGLIKEPPTLNIALPRTEAYDKAAEKKLARDGYELKPKPNASQSVDAQTLGPKMALVLQWLAAAPLDVLCKHLGVSYADLFAMAAYNESKVHLIEAMARSLLGEAAQRTPAHVVEALLNTELVCAELTLALVGRMTLAQKQAQLIKPNFSCRVSDLCTIFSAAEGMGEALSDWILDFLRSHKHSSYNRAWNDRDTVALVLRLDTQLAQAFLQEALAEQSRNLAGMPSDKTCYEAAYWQHLFQALQLCIQYRTALAPATP